MLYLGVSYEINHIPVSDPEFIPFGVWTKDYMKDANKPVAIAIEREKGYTYVHHTYIHGTAQMYEADYYRQKISESTAIKIFLMRDKGEQNVQIPLSACPHPGGIGN